MRHDHDIRQLGDFARETAWQKIRNRVEGTRLAAEKLGVG